MFRPRALVAGAILGVVVATSLACSSHQAALAPRTRLADSASKGLLPQDDGFDLAIFYGGELMGSVDGCGCFGNAQLGGLPYRFGYTEGFRDAYPGVATLQLDAGQSMGTVTDPQGTELADLVVRDDWVLRALGDLQYDAANLTSVDLEYLARYLTINDWDQARARHPMLDRFVSANLRPVRQGLRAPSPFVVRSLDGERLDTPLRIGITGVTAPQPVALRCGFEVLDPAAALADTLPRLRAECDLVIVLAYLPSHEAEALAAAYGAQVDLWVVAQSITDEIAGELRGPIRVVRARYKSQALGELLVSMDGRSITAATNRYVKLDEPLPRDPLAEELAAEAKRQVREAQMERFRK